MQLREQQKNLHTYLNNMPYEQRHPVFNHLMQFVSNNDSFWIRSSILNNGDQVFSYIELVGFITIGKNMIELRVMIPHNYPLAAPQFDLVFNSESYDITSHGPLVANKTIALRRNLANQELIRLNYQSLRRLWQRPETRIIGHAFNEILKEVNSPPLLVPKSRENFQMTNSMKNIGRNKSGGLTESFINQLELEVITLQEKQGTVQAVKLESDYKEARADFLMRNAPKLEKMMKNSEVKISKNLAELRAKHEQIVTKDSLDPILVMNPDHEARLNAVARHDAMKEAERKLLQRLQTNLSQQKVNFQGQKGVLRQFYEEMFDSQLQYLRCCE